MTPRVVRAKGSRNTSGAVLMHGRTGKSVVGRRDKASMQVFLES